MYIFVWIILFVVEYKSTARLSKSACDKTVLIDDNFLPNLVFILSSAVEFDLANPF